MGYGEIILILIVLLMMGVGVGAFFLLARRFLSPGGPAPMDRGSEVLEQELRETRGRMELLESHVSQLEEKLAFTQALLENRDEGARTHHGQ